MACVCNHLCDTSRTECIHGTTRLDRRELSDTTTSAQRVIISMLANWRVRTWAGARVGPRCEASARGCDHPDQVRLGGTYDGPQDLCALRCHSRRFRLAGSSIGLIPLSIYATLWALQFPRFGEFHTGCEWVTVIAQLVPAHVGAEVSDPYAQFLPALPNSVAVDLRAVVFSSPG